MLKPIVDIVNACDFPSMIPAVAQWHHQEWAHLNPGQTLSVRIEKMASYLDASVLSPDSFSPTLFIALNAEGEPVGTAALDLHDMDCQPILSPWLASVYVLPEMRRRGIASALVAHAVNCAVSEMGVDQMYLFTPNQRVFYEGLGWSQLQHLLYYGDEVDLMLYQRDSSAQ